ncbi:MAG: GxxExxY protein [Candidatus Cloacimonadota bacterium]|nr:GxxExxY protein [Candidatus Cloacimonadota bacterium]
MNKNDLIYHDEFYKIKGACIAVRKELGNGFLEKLYENALVIELRDRGFKVDNQKHFEVYYKDQLIGNYLPDIIVDDKIIIELKCVSEISKTHKAQVINYLKITDFKLGIIINFPNDNLGFTIERIPNFIKQ